MTTVVPAIIPGSKSDLEEGIEKVAKFAKLIQIDISDGIFTPIKTWPYNGVDQDFFNKLKNEETGWPRWHDLDFEVHLMVKSPENVVLDWIHSGVSSVVAQIEATDNFQKVIDLCKENSVSIGVAIKPSTDISKLAPFVSEVNFIQVMGNDILGKHGMALDQKALEMIKSLHATYPESIIGIDIGVSVQTKEKLVSLGATRLISGGAILKAANPEEVYRNLESN